ncbi:hypothetical protein GCM10007967_09860 [Xylanimonas ulmi]
MGALSGDGGGVSVNLVVSAPRGARTYWSGWCAHRHPRWAEQTRGVSKGTFGWPPTTHRDGSLAEVLSWATEHAALLHGGRFEIEWRL